MANCGQTGALEEWRAHWRVVLPAVVGVMLAATHGHALGVMIRPIEAEFGWARAEISSGFLIIAVTAVLVSPLVGNAVDRYGARRIALFGVPFYCIALGLLSLTPPSLPAWWGLWFVLALGNMSVLPVVWLAVLNGYFLKSRGLAMAIALSGTGLAAAIVPYLTNSLVEALGWRQAYVALAAIMAMACLPLALALFRPAPVARDGAHASSVEERTGARGQMASPRFLKLAAASIVFAIASCALTNNMVPVLIGEGLDPARAAATAGLLGIGSIAGRLVGGLLLDRFDGNKVAAASVLLPIVPASILLVTDHSLAWASIACIAMGLSIGTELDCCAYLAARHFGTRHFGTLFGSINGMLLFGAGIAPLAANYVYDVTRSYDLVLTGLIPLFFITALLFLSLGRYPALDPARPAATAH